MSEAGLHRARPAGAVLRKQAESLLGVGDPADAESQRRVARVKALRLGEL